MTTADYIFIAAIAVTNAISFYQGWRAGLSKGLVYGRAIGRLEALYSDGGATKGFEA